MLYPLESLSFESCLKVLKSAGNVSHRALVSLAVTEAYSLMVLFVSSDQAAVKSRCERDQFVQNTVRLGIVCVVY